MKPGRCGSMCSPAASAGLLTAAASVPGSASSTRSSSAGASAGVGALADRFTGADPRAGAGAADDFGSLAGAGGSCDSVDSARTSIAGVGVHGGNASAPDSPAGAASTSGTSEARLRIGGLMAVAAPFCVQIAPRRQFVADAAPSRVTEASGTSLARREIARARAVTRRGFAPRPRVRPVP
ncbi:hypothetical protein [Nannocystis pusilla]|uniref:hypothetical protein n=1 Tax=Nannocystis pusilla TaxID=889268 RepID=UPI003B7A17A9